MCVGGMASCTNATEMFSTYAIKLEDMYISLWLNNSNELNQDTIEQLNSVHPSILTELYEI